MVDTQEAVPPAPRPSRRRRRRLSVYVIAPVAFLLLLGVARFVYWRVSLGYAPLQPTGFIGATAGTANHLTGAQSANWQLSGPPGTIQVLDFSLHNTGSQPVDITTVDVSDPLILNVHWAANYPGIAVAPPHDFPLHLAGHATAKIRFTVLKPECGDGTRLLSAVITLRWRAMMNSHVTELDLAKGDPTLLALCDG
jgi:hypothetical protein